MSINPVVVWFLVGLVMIISEFMLPGVILVFFGIGAWIAALVTWLGLTPDLEIQFLVFAITSVLSLVLLRRRFREGFFGKVTEEGRAGDNIDDEVGGLVVVLEDMTPGTKGRVEFKGAAWQALCDTTLVKGDRAIITAHEGITLIIEPQ